MSVIYAMDKKVKSFEIDKSKIEELTVINKLKVQSKALNSIIKRLNEKETDKTINNQTQEKEWKH